MSMSPADKYPVAVSEIRTGVRHGLTRREKNGIVYFTVPSIDETGRFSFIFTSRIGGVSGGCYSSLNLSVSREQDRANKAENYRRAAQCAGVDPRTLVRVNYEHGSGIALVTKDNIGDGLTHETTLPPCDALVVQEPFVTALTLHADCVPVVVADPAKGIGAVAHAGWKGTAACLPEKLVTMFVDEFGSDPADLLCAIGPHIKTCCFEVGQEVADRFEETFGRQTVVQNSGEKPHVDLEAAILLQMACNGIPPKNITVSDLCTSCEDELFYSYRRDHGQTGAMGALMAVLPT